MGTVAAACSTHTLHMYSSVWVTAGRRHGEGAAPVGVGRALGNMLPQAADSPAQGNEFQPPGAEA